MMMLSTDESTYSLSKKNMFMLVIINVWLLTHITLYINFYLGFGEGGLENRN
jgi:hypothetical protein